MREGVGKRNSAREKAGTRCCLYTVGAFQQKKETAHFYQGVGKLLFFRGGWGRSN